MFAHSAVAAVSDRRRRSEIDATIPARSQRRLQGNAQELMSFCRGWRPAFLGILSVPKPVFLAKCTSVRRKCPNLRHKWPTFFTGTLSEIYLFSYIYRLRSYFSNIFFFCIPRRTFPKALIRRQIRVKSFMAGERSFLWGISRVPHSPSTIRAKESSSVAQGLLPVSDRPGAEGWFTCRTFMLPVFWSRDMQTPFWGQPARGRSDPPTAFTTRLARAQLCCQVNSGAISCRQEKILQIPPPISYRPEFPFSEWPKLGQDVRGFADSIAPTRVPRPRQMCGYDRLWSM